MVCAGKFHGQRLWIRHDFQLLLLEVNVAFTADQQLADAICFLTYIIKNTLFIP